jgi:hypothetical protein
MTSLTTEPRTTTAPSTPARPMHHLVGLLLGMEEDWPRAFETISRRLGAFSYHGAEHVIDTERVRIEPFDLRAPTRYQLVIDRLAYWYYHPREWLKKIALMNDVYLLNSPFTFQSMEKHSAYCALMRLGMNVPATVLVPYKNPLDNVRWAYTSQRYNEPFDLAEVAHAMGYPMYMKPFDGGAWRGVSRINNDEDLWRAYNESGEMLMHLQKAVEPYDVFARALTIGPETMVMNFRPDQPMHLRYAVDYDFLSPSVGAEAVTIAQTVNAFFRWEFNSCEMLIQGDQVLPIDYANACPDVAVTSLHYYFPWAMTSLVKWTAFCLASDRRVRPHIDTTDWFEVADDPERGYGEKLAAYQRLADDYFERDKYRDFCDTALPDIAEMVLYWVSSPDFDSLLVETVVSTYPQHEHEMFLAHFRGLISLWVRDQQAA